MKKFILASIVGASLLASNVYANWECSASATYWNGWEWRMAVGYGWHPTSPSQACKIALAECNKSAPRGVACSVN